MKEFYQNTVAPQLMKEAGYKNIYLAPKITKILVHVGFGKMSKEPKIKETVEATLKRITGQKPVWAKAKQSISNFKVQQGEIIGAKVTLRGQRMYDFLEKLVKATLPRVRDFRGLSAKTLDQRGNLSIGFKEHIAFPEIRSDEVEKIHGLEVTVVTNARSRQEAESLFKKIGFPLQ